MAPSVIEADLWGLGNTGLGRRGATGIHPMSWVKEPGNLAFLTTSFPKLWDRRTGKCLDLGRREEVRGVRQP